MIDDSTRPPEALLSVVARDLRPVKPSPLPLGLVLRMAVPAAIVSSLVLLFLGVRRDFRILGPLLTWGASVAEFGLAILLVWVAAHENTPSKRLPRGKVYLVVITTVLAVIALTCLTSWTNPSTGSSRITPWVAGLTCGVGATIAGGILIGLFSWVYRDSLVTRPTLTGALYGAGAGVAINSGWRIACPGSAPGHVFGAHGTAVIATVLFGALAARILMSRARASRSEKI